MRRMKRLHDKGQLDVFVDLHNPGGSVQHPFFLLPPRTKLSDLVIQRQRLLLTTCRQQMTESMPFRGATYESGSNYDSRWRSIAKNWVALQLRGVVAVTLETPWNVAQSHRTGYENVGRGLGRAIVRYAVQVRRIAE